MDWFLSVAGEAIAAILAAAAIALFASLSGALKGLRRKIEELEDASARHDEDIRAEARREVRAIEVRLKSQVERHESDIAALQAAQITHEDLGKVYGRLDTVVQSVAKFGTDLTAKVSELKGEVTATRSQAEMVYGYLLKRD